MKPGREKRRNCWTKWRECTEVDKTRQGARKKKTDGRSKRFRSDQKPEIGGISRTVASLFASLIECRTSKMDCFVEICRNSLSMIERLAWRTPGKDESHLFEEGRRRQSFCQNLYFTADFSESRQRVQTVREKISDHKDMEKKLWCKEWILHMGILTSFMPVSIMFSRSHEVKGGILNGPSIDLDQEPCFNLTNFLLEKRRSPRRCWASLCSTPWWFWT